MKLVSSNTGPLIAFSHISRLDILPLLFTDVIIPLGVFEEYKYKGNEYLPSEIKVQKLNREIDTFLLEQLDRGECEVISLAKDENPDYVLIDERKGRKIAEL